MFHLSTSVLRPNAQTSRLYTVDTTFETFVRWVEVEGILEPLLVFEVGGGFYQVISGNRRLMAAQRLGFETVPCVLQEVVELTESRVIGHQQHREKLPSEIIRDLRVLEERYNLRQGVRNNTPLVQEGKKLRKAMLEEFGKSTIDRLRRFEKDVRELVGDDNEAYQDFMADLDRSKSISGSCTKVKNLLKKRSNEEIAGDIQEVSGENYTVHRGSCTSMSHLEDGSVATVVTSPPYFQMRVYENGVPASAQLGQEPTVGAFCENLSHVFDEAYRVLKADGSLFVNITDCIQHGRMLCVPHHFVLAMLKRGWILNDTIVWSKVNPMFQDTKRTLASHEYIYHFVKSVEFFYDKSWIQDMDFTPHDFTYGGAGKVLSLRSHWKFDGHVLETITPNNHELRVECKKIGMSLTHSATFPKEIPLVAILSSSRPGDVVVDMFNGTGTTGEVAVATGRKYVGYELSPVYMKFTEVRMNTLKQRKPVVAMNSMISSCHFVPDFNADLSFKWAI